MHLSRPASHDSYEPIEGAPERVRWRWISREGSCPFGLVVFLGTNRPLGIAVAGKPRERERLLVGSPFD